MDNLKPNLKSSEDRFPGSSSLLMIIALDDHFKLMRWRMHYDTTQVSSPNDDSGFRIVDKNNV
jgi:hypothetical protein